MFKMPMTRRTLDKLKTLERLERPPAVVAFSCNAYRQVWPEETTQWHREDQRSYCQGKLQVLDEIVAMMLEVRPNGGRFFVDWDGVFHRENWPNEERFIQFTWE